MFILHDTQVFIDLSKKILFFDNMNICILQFQIYSAVWATALAGCNQMNDEPQLINDQQRSVYCNVN